MEDTVIVVMLKDPVTGFLEKELGTYDLTAHEELLYNIYAEQQDGKTQVVLRLTTERDVEDWEFEAIYDYYDAAALAPWALQVEEEEDCFNPIWKVTVPFLEEPTAMEEAIDGILSAHWQELSSVYEVIKDKKDEYQ